MNPIGSLEREHRVLARLLDALEAWADGLLENQDTSRSDLDLFMKIVGELADVAHHEKEEDILMPLLYKKGLSWDTGALRRMRDEHDQERYLTRVIQQAASQDGDWSKEDRRHLLASIEAYVSFQRKHMQREDDILYPNVHTLSEGEQQALATSLAEFDDRFGRARYEALIQEAETLAERYGA